MESQMARPHGQSQEQEPHVVGNQMEGEDEHHHDMKSVLKKVKAKAKKIKDTFRRHDQSQDHDHDHDLDVEEKVDDPENHGAPIHEAEAIKSETVEPSEQSGFIDGRSSSMDFDPLPPVRTANPGDASHVHEQEERMRQSKVNFGLSQNMDEAPASQQNTPVSDTSTETHHSSRDHDPTKTFVPGQEEHPGKPKVNLQIPEGGLVEAPGAPKDTPGDYSSPSNYQSKVTDPTGKGGQEASISPVLPSFDKMSIYDESKPKSGQEENWPTGTEESFDDPVTQEHTRDNTAVTFNNADDRQSNRSSYTEKILAATGIADKAISAKNIVASKLGYGNQGDRGGEQEVNTAGDKSKSSMPIYFSADMTFTKHDQSHDQDHDHDHDLDQDEKVDDPENHGAPMHDAEAIKSETVEPSEQSGFIDGRSSSMDVDPLRPARTSNPGDASHVHEQEERMRQPKVNFDLSQNMDEAPESQQNTPVSDSSTETHHSSRDHDPTKTFVPGQEEHPGKPKVNLQIPGGGLVEAPGTPKDTPGDYSSPSNYQSEVTDPTGKGGQEASISAVIPSFDKKSIYGESKPKSEQEENWTTRTEESFDGPITQEHTRDNTAVTEDNADDRQSNRSSYTEKILSASGIAHKAISAKNVVASKLGYGDQGDRGGEQEVNTAGDKSKSSMPMYEAEAIKSVGTVEPSGQSGYSDGRSTSMDIDPLPPARTANPGDASHVHEQEDRMGQPKVNSGLTLVMDEVPKTPQNTPVSDTSAEEHPGQPKVNLQIPGGGLVEDPDASKDTSGDYSTPSNCQSEVTDPSGKGDQEAIISPVLHSFDKMSIHDESKPKSGQEQNWPTRTEESFDGTTQEHSDDNTAVTEETFDSTSNREHPQDNADDRQLNQSSYTEKISSDTSAIADKAISAENVVGSKVGYGEQGDRGRGQEVNAAGDKSESSMPETAADHGKKISVTATESLTHTGTGSEKEHDVRGKYTAVSVKNYFAEKLRPGEDDRALSEVISEALHKKTTEKEDRLASSRPVTEVISDASHKRNEEPNEATDRPMGKVTESAEVARRLGNMEHDSSKEGMNSSFVNKIKGAVGSWFGGKGEETHEGSQQSLNAPIGNNNNNITEERRLQESGN